MSSVSDQQRLADQARHGDQGALGQLLQNHQHRLYNVVLRMVGHRDDAADVTQGAMFKIVEHIGDFRGQSDISTWMTRIAMNLCFSLLRKRRLRRTTSLDASGGDLGDDQLTPLRHQLSDSGEPGPELRVQKDEMIRHLHAALNRLPDELRAVLVLRDIDEMTYQAIAEVLNVPVGTVKSRLFRARLALRHEMLKLDHDPLPSPKGFQRAGGKGSAGAAVHTRQPHPRGS